MKSIYYYNVSTNDDNEKVLTVVEKTFFENNQCCDDTFITNDDIEINNVLDELFEPYSEWQWEIHNNITNDEIQQKLKDYGITIEQNSEFNEFMN